MAVIEQSTGMLMLSEDPMNMPYNPIRATDK